MKLSLLILGFLSLTACSSLITRNDLRDCESQCKAKETSMVHVSKNKGQLSCECAPTKEEKEALEQDIKGLLDTMDKIDADAAKQVEVPANESEVIPAAAEQILEHKKENAEESVWPAPCY